MKILHITNGIEWSGGMEQIVQITLTPEEDAALKKSAAAVKELVDVIKM